MARVYRTELKYRICALDRQLLLCRLSKALQPDSHTQNGMYSVRTLYFDSPYDNALSDSLDGSAEKVKFRMRIYNGDVSFIRLEKKVRTGRGGFKTGVCISPEECTQLLHADAAWMRSRDDPFLQECYARAASGFLRPSVLLSYDRDAFICRQGNVRITIDSRIHASHNPEFFLRPGASGAPVTADNICVLEVKYDAFLPDFIPHLIGIGDLPLQAFSKFAAGKIID